MIDFKRGVSAKDLRPFSVEDPLGQRGRSSPAPTRWSAQRSRGGKRSAPHAGSDGVASPVAAGVRIAKLVWIFFIMTWAIGLLVGSASWIPELVARVKPTLDGLLGQLVTGFEESRPREDDAQGRSADPPSPEPGAPDPGASVDAGRVDSAADRPVPESTQSAPLQDDQRASASLQHVCARTVGCCLTVQGERGRALCENFARLPTVEPCQQAYEVFADVAGKMGKTCQ